MYVSKESYFSAVSLFKRRDSPHGGKSKKKEKEGEKKKHETNHSGSFFYGTLTV